MLETGVLPARQHDSNNAWSWIENGHDHQYPILNDNQILLVLRYPKKFALTTLAVLGDLISLNNVSSPRYFDKVVLSSRLNDPSEYRFGSQDLMPIVCDDGVVGSSSKFDIYQGRDFCRIMGSFEYGDTLKVVPNWNCSSTDGEYCNKSGPFMSHHGDGVFADVLLWMRMIRCEPGTLNLSEVRVAAEFKVVPVISENIYLVSQRTGLMNGVTLWGEGTWNPSSGQLCMVGCIGLDDNPMCNCRICMYILQFLSIIQHSYISGKIFSINSTHFPLSFEKPFPTDGIIKGMSITIPFKYTFSKIKFGGYFF